MRIEDEQRRHHLDRPYENESGSIRPTAIERSLAGMEREVRGGLPVPPPLRTQRGARVGPSNLNS
jgi:hypothetical protein